MSSIDEAVGNYYVVIMEPLCLLYSRRQIEFSYAIKDNYILYISPSDRRLPLVRCITGFL
jgi:hypothetical protein